MRGGGPSLLSFMEMFHWSIKHTLQGVRFWRQERQARTERTSALRFCSQKVAEDMSETWSWFCTHLSSPLQVEGAIQVPVQSSTICIRHKHECWGCGCILRAGMQEMKWETIKPHRKRVSRCCVQAYRSPVIDLESWPICVPLLWVLVGCLLVLPQSSRSHSTRFGHSLLYPRKHHCEIQEAETSVFSGWNGSVFSAVAVWIWQRTVSKGQVLSVQRSSGGAGRSSSVDWEVMKLYELSWTEHWEGRLYSDKALLKSAGLLQHCCPVM